METEDIKEAERRKREKVSERRKVGTSDFCYR